MAKSIASPPGRSLSTRSTAAMITAELSWSAAATPPLLESHPSSETPMKPSRKRTPPWYLRRINQSINRPFTSSLNQSIDKDNQPITPSMNQSIHESINHAINNQSINPTSQPSDKPVKRPITRFINQSNQSTCSSTHQSMGRPINQSNQSTNQAINLSIISQCRVRSSTSAAIQYFTARNRHFHA